MREVEQQISNVVITTPVAGELVALSEFSDEIMIRGKIWFAAELGQLYIKWGDADAEATLSDFDAHIPQGCRTPIFIPATFLVADVPTPVTHFHIIANRLDGLTDEWQLVAQEIESP